MEMFITPFKLVNNAGQEATFAWADTGTVTLSQIPAATPPGPKPTVLRQGPGVIITTAQPTVQPTAGFTMGML
jgi:hypothetical protein